MSRADTQRSGSTRRRARDGGYSLVELLICMSLIGVVVAAISMATSTVARTRASSLGRANNARSEQVIGLWMPADLASAETVDTTAGAMPCGPTPACPPGANVGGSNAVMLTWTGSETDGSGNAIVTKTVVSYRVIQVGTEFQMVRVECYSVGGGAPTCKSAAVLHNLDPPPPGVPFEPGHDSPSWIITVSNALPADDISGPGATVPPADPGLKNKNGQRVVVTINGGGASAGAGGGQNQITLSAGGTDRELNLATTDLTGAPTFTAARSRCGGNFGLLVDTSGSIGSQMGNVRDGIIDFIDTFAGTPIKLEIVRFSATASALGAAGGEWVHYYDMLVDSDVAALKSLVSGLVSSGTTNWEDGVFRMLKNSDGTVQANPPNTIIFFTDGVPTRSRIDGTSASAPVVVDPADGGLPASNGSTFSQIGWNRAERLIRDRGKVTMIGVFVNANTAATSQWTTAGAGYHYVYQRGDTVVFQRGSHPNYQIGNALSFDRAYHYNYEIGNALSFEKGYHNTYDVGNALSFEKGYHNTYDVGNALLFEKGYHLAYERNNNLAFQNASSGVVFEQYNGSSWVSKTESQFLSNNTTPDSSDNWRIRVTGTLGSWSNMTPTQYERSNSTADQSEGVKQTLSSLSSSWTTTTAAAYAASNTTTDSNDGWRTVKVYSAPFDSWESSTQSAYLTGNTANDATDGWRATVTGSSTSWTSVNASQYAAGNTTADNTDGWRISSPIYSSPYDSWETSALTPYLAGNTVNDATDGWRVTTTGSSTSWTSVTAGQYSASNTTADSTDGWRISSPIYSSPFDSWEVSTKTLYLAGNTTTLETDGWRAIDTGTSSTWSTITAAQYAASNVTTDSNDGWRTTNVYSTPFDLWEASTQSSFLAANTNNTASDGWRSTPTGTSTTWTNVTAAQYNAANVSADESDGWRAPTTYTYPYSNWENVSQATYDAAVTSYSATDGWQTVLSGPVTSWTDVTKAAYDVSNSTSNASDGWQAIKSYSPPYDAFENVTTKSILDYATLGNIVVDNTSGDPGVFVQAVPAGGPYTNAAVADLFVLPDYDKFSDALSTVALAQCGGTVTMQTRVGSNAAQDPFTYQIAPSNEIVQTSAAYRSGTFDVALPGGASKEVTINPQEFTDLVRYSPAGWSCKSAGAAYPFTVVPVADHAPWTGIKLTVGPNKAVSCILQVTFS